VNYTDKVDLYQLRMKPGKSLEYRYNGEWQMLEMRKVKLKVKGIPVSVSKKTYWSKYGATIRTNKGTFSVRFSANQEIRGMEQWWRMNKAGNFSEFYQAISMQGLPMFNIVYADKYDTIFYISGGKMPLRNKAYNWRQTVPGDSSATLWEAFHAIGDLPQYLNPPSGYLFNTNHSPFHATAPAYDLDANQYDQTSGYETYDNNRSARFAELMADKQSLDYQTFKKIKYDNQLPMTLRYQLNIDSIAQVKQETYPDLGELISTLQQWNLESDTGSQGAALFRLLYEYASGHRKEFPNDTLTVAGAVEAFRYARQHQEQYFGRTGIALGELQQHRRGTKSLASWGLPDVLTAMYSRPQPDGRFKVMAGESYIQLVRFPRNQLPIIESINCYGASTNPGSPHFTDQMDMFIRQQTKPMTLDKETVLKQARSVYHPGLDQRKK
jgi:acyl-homoserine-lactone acylase